ncbi:MAG: hypothetical protein KDB79_00325 [Acidobacteria bacterium]|nr:hypothetical protein [Acidobacteriota bacterium]
MDRLSTGIKDHKLLASVLNIKALLLFGGVAHVFATFAVYLIGAARLVPNWIYPEGVLREDPSRYLIRCRELSLAMSNGNFDFLYTYQEQIQIRLYALSHFLQARFIGSNVLTFELVNLPLFLALLFLVYKIGEIVFGKRIGIVSAYLLVFFPSLMLHTTQPLRDLLFIVVFLFLVFLLLKLLTKDLSAKQSFGWVAIACLNFLLLWFVRDSMFPVYFAVVLAAFVFMAIRVFYDGWRFKWNVFPLTGLAIAIFLTPFLLSNYLPLKRGEKPESRDSSIVKSNVTNRSGQPAYLRKINTIRYGFSVSYRDAGSNIDAGYLFENSSDLITYLPKAAAIGLFAPFPNTWLGEGVEYGKTGRLISGFETLIFYLIMILAVYSVYKDRSLPTFFLATIFLIGVTSLGLVMINVGAIYRMRYVFWILLIIAATNGALKIATSLRIRQTEAII